MKPEPPPLDPEMLKSYDAAEDNIAEMIISQHDDSSNYGFDSVKEKIKINCGVSFH